MSGGIEVMRDVVLPYNRIAIILFAIGVLVAMGSCSRARPARPGRARGDAEPRHGRLHGHPDRARRHVDVRHRLGRGGPRGVALSQIGNVGPELGQGYIVDWFMVVVLGGVVSSPAPSTRRSASASSTSCSKPVGRGARQDRRAGLIIVFIQKRPQGLFALKGRAVEARAPSARSFGRLHGRGAGSRSALRACCSS